MSNRLSPGKIRAMLEPAEPRSLGKAWLVLFAEQTHLLKLKASKFSRGGYAPPAPPPSGCGEAGKGLQGKILGDGNNEKRRKWFSPFLIFNFNK